MRISSLLASTVLAAGLALVGTTAASAAPIVFTWNPNGSSPALSSAGSQFTADNLTVRDYATINLTGGLSNVTETGTLVVTAISGGSSILPGFVNGSGAGAAGAIPGATPYQLYFTFSGTSSLAPDGSGGLTGSFTSLNYTLYGDVGGACTFGLGGASCGSSGQQLALLTGSLGVGPDVVSIDSTNVPGAHVDVTVGNGAQGGNFFVNPALLAGFEFETSFINTPGVIGGSTASGIITINGGGGNVDLIPIPEPVTLSIFGAGLAGAAAMRRRKAKKA